METYICIYEDKSRGIVFTENVTRAAKLLGVTDEYFNKHGKVSVNRQEIKISQDVPDVCFKRLGKTGAPWGVFIPESNE